MEASVENVSLDRLSERRLAESDPAFFLTTHSRRPLFIDEIQYAPNLFPEIKLQVDRWRTERRLSGEGSGENLFFLTGSNQTLMARSFRESLAGRASFYRMHTLSLREILREKPDFHVPSYLIRGGWPELQVDEKLPARSFLDAYVTTFLEKDIAFSAGIAKLGAFETALGLLAARSGRQLNVSEIAGQCGVDATTLRSWIAVLEQNFVLALVPPYSDDLSKRLVKSPKLYFLEPSLASHLQGWSELGPLLKSPQGGPLFETFVFAEIQRTIDHEGLAAKVFFLRTRDGEEVDFLIQGSNGIFLLIEAKLGIESARAVTLGPELRKVLPAGTRSFVVTIGGEEMALSRASIRVPITRLADRMSEFFKDSAD